MKKPTTQRLAALDRLRGGPVLLVLCGDMPHSPKRPEWVLAPLRSYDGDGR